jgi:chemotaxis regulatin CheY-phosphate phosphatase CheZ
MADRNAATNDSADPSLEDIRARLERMETFFSRRFDEVSAEVNAASQLVGMAEDSVKERFGEIIGVLEAISSHGDGTSRVQAGVELDAVLKITEEAATRILDAADRIGERLDDDEVWTDAEKRETAIADTKNDVQEILMASAFQDLTGQRIQNTIENLQMIESRLSQTLSKFGIEPDTLVTDTQDYMEPGTTQENVDTMFDQASSGRSGRGNGASAQSDVDSLFD